jgi:hypothetical protein
VAASDPAREFEETEHKAAAMRRAIELAVGGTAAPAVGTAAGAAPARETAADGGVGSAGPEGAR